MSALGVRRDVDVYVSVPLVNKLGAAFADIVYPFPLTVDAPEASPIDDPVVFRAEAEVALGSQMIPVDIEVSVSDLVTAPDGWVILRTKPVVVEPVETVERLEIVRDTEPVSSSPDVPRRVVTVER